MGGILIIMLAFCIYLKGNLNSIYQRLLIIQRCVHTESLCFGELIWSMDMFPIVLSMVTPPPRMTCSVKKNCQIVFSSFVENLLPSKI